MLAQKVASEPTASAVQIGMALAEIESAGCPPDDQKELRKARNLALEALVAHPSMALETLQKFVNWAPTGFCRNPIAPLLLIESPELLKALHETSVLTILSCEDASAALVHTLVACYPLPGIAQVAALHIQLRGEILDSCWRDEIMSHLQSIAAVAIAANPEEVADLAALGYLSGPAVDDIVDRRQRIVRHGASEARFSRLIVLMDPEVGRGDLLRALRSVAWTDRLVSVLNPVTAILRPQIVESFCQDGNALVRAAARARRRGESFSIGELIAGIDIGRE